ncbi:MAG: methyltransferase domain-containing protein [Parvularculaceae bacterium]
MFDFIRKPFLWKAFDEELDREIGKTKQFHLKSVQDLAVYDMLKGERGKTIAEIGGGDSRLLAKLSKENRCFNIDKFEGADGGPAKVIRIRGVTNVQTFLGERSPLLNADQFDIVFSISVIEHVPTAALGDFLEDGLRILKSGGLWLHAIDFYLDDAPDAGVAARFEKYRTWLSHPMLEPLGAVYDGPPRFTCDMATNPDNVMHGWGKIAPKLIELRQKAQSVSLLLGARKK